MRQADWEAIAARYNIWLPHFEPVTLAMQDKLQILPGDQCLDFASGTGEPALSFAAASPSAHFLLTDKSKSMLEFAQYRADQAGLRNVSTQPLEAHALAEPGRQFDVISSRFGLMLIDDRPALIRTLRQVSRPGCQWCFTTWSDEPGALPSMEWVWRSCQDLLPAEYLPPMTLATSLGNEHRIRALLATVPVETLDIQRCEFTLQTASFDAYWQMLQQSGVMDDQLERMTTSQSQLLYQRMQQLAAPALNADGLSLRHVYWLITLQLA